MSPAADVLHEYEFGCNPGKHYLLERNRLVFVLSSFSPKLPVLGAGAGFRRGRDAGTRAQGGLGGDKVRGWWWLIRNAGWLRRHRRETQKAPGARPRASLGS